LVGAPLGGEVVIIDDVITAGASIRQSVAAIRAAGATPHAVVIALDRLERAGAEGLSAAQQVEREHGIAVHALIDLRDLAAHFAQAGQTQSAHAAAIKSYRERYGVK
ncbi:MAG: orotate phosphoribosyltransferase, partial [Gammaproteobacteria bacterium]